MKITFMGAGSTVFAKNVIGDCMLTPSLCESEFALYDILEDRLEESFIMVNALNKNINDGKAKISKFLGVENRKAALKDADFVINAIQVGFYEPCTVLEFEIPKKYGLRQTIGDTLGIGGIMRGLRTIHVLQDFAKDMEEVCPQALFINYTNPMAILTGFMNRYTNIKTIGLCHSVQVCSDNLLKELGMQDKLEGRKEFENLLKIIKKGDTLIFDSVSRMSRNSEEGCNLYGPDRVRSRWLDSGGLHACEHHKGGHKDDGRKNPGRRYGKFCRIGRAVYQYIKYRR